MDKFGDPGFYYHRTMAQIWAMLILELSDREILPFDFGVYAAAVKDYVANLDTFAKGKGSENEGLKLDSLYQASDEFARNAEEFHAWGKAWEDAIGEGGFESNVMAIKRMSHNSRMGNFETNLLDVDGGVSIARIAMKKAPRIDSNGLTRESAVTRTRTVRPRLIRTFDWRWLRRFHIPRHPGCNRRLELDVGSRPG